MLKQFSRKTKKEYGSAYSVFTKDASENMNNNQNEWQAKW